MVEEKISIENEIYGLCEEIARINSDNIKKLKRTEEEKTDGARKKEDQRATQEAKEFTSSLCLPLCPPEIKKDIEERNKNIDIRNLEVDLDDRTSGFNLYCAFIKKTEERFGRKLGSDESDRLKYLIDIYGQEDVLYALNESSRVEKLSVGYMEGILTNRSGENPNLYC